MTLKINAWQLETAAWRFFATCVAAQLRGNIGCNYPSHFTLASNWIHYTCCILYGLILIITVLDYSESGTAWVCNQIKVSTTVAQTTMLPK